MRVQAVASEAGEERGADELHEPRADDQVRLVFRAPGRERLVPLLPRAEVADLEGEGGDVRPVRTLQRADAFPVGADGDHGRAVRRVRACVDQRLQVRALPRDKDDQPRFHGSHSNRYGTMGSDMAKLTDQQPPARYAPPGAPRPPRVPADPSLQQRAWAALALAVQSLLSLMLIGNLRRGVYVVAVALVIAVIALWVALRVMSRSRRGGTSRPRGATLAVILGAAG